MENFDLYMPTRLVFGRGAHKQIGALIAPHARKVLFLYGGGSIRKTGLYDAVAASLREAGVEWVELSGVVPNPHLDLAEKGVALCRESGATLVLAVGGGSVIDTAKAIAAGYYHEQGVWDLYANGPEIERALPVVTLLTIPAAGSEVSGDTVITHVEKQIKRGFSSPRLRPLISVVNPELFFTLPPYQIASGVADMMSHIFERYFTNTPNVELTDRLCEATLCTILHQAPKLIKNPRDYEAWCEVGFSGSIAHNNLLGLGRAQDWACHDMEHQLSALYDVTHGAGLAVLTPAWMTYVSRTNQPMFLQFATRVMGVTGSLRDPDACIAEAIDKLRAFYRALGLPGSLRELGIDDKNLSHMAQMATDPAFVGRAEIGGLKKLGMADVLDIYKLAL